MQVIMGLAQHPLPRRLRHHRAAAERAPLVVCHSVSRSNELPSTDYARNSSDLRFRGPSQDARDDDDGGPVEFIDRSVAAAACSSSSRVGLCGFRSDGDWEFFMS